jgi:hypothetical protein
MHACMHTYIHIHIVYVYVCARARKICKIFNVFFLYQEEKALVLTVNLSDVGLALVVGDGKRRNLCGGEQRRRP